MITSKNIPFDGTNIVLLDSGKNFAKFSVETVLSNNLNYWKNWSCSIGLNSLYIDYDGNVYNAVCREGGVLGNIHTATEDFKKTQDWTDCSKTVCTCGADMAIPKVKNKEDIVKFFDKGIVKEFRLNNQVTSLMPEVVISTDGDNFKRISWSVGRRCNFDCWYCPASDHNNYEEHKTYEQLMQAYDNLEKFWIKGNKVKFSMLGGELTVYKDYLPFVKTLHSMGHMSITTTNGSRNPEYYQELAKFSDVCFSIHLNYVKELGVEKFIDSVEQALLGKGSNWVSVRIMIDPGNLEIAQTVYNRFKEKFGDGCPINVKPVHPAPNRPLYSYTPKEIFWIRNPT
jgi:MoaA/NifB/PqqE/SkfB family radical SAM enzyme